MCTVKFLNICTRKIAKFEQCGSTIPKTWDHDGYTFQYAILCTNHVYCNFPKFSDRQVWANSADPDQTAPRGAV